MCTTPTTELLTRKPAGTSAPDSRAPLSGTALPRVVLFADDSASAAELAHRLDADPGLSSASCRSPESARQLLTRRADVVLLCGEWIPRVEACLDALHRWPSPEVALLGADSRADPWLRARGLPPSAVYTRHWNVDQVHRHVQLLVDLSIPLRDIVRRTVGTLGLKQVQEQARRVMLCEALVQANHSRRGAAKILQVSRPAVQQMIASLDVAVRGKPRDGC